MIDGSFVVYPRKYWSNYEECLAEILDYLFLSNRPGEVSPRHAELHIMRKIINSENTANLELFIFIVIKDNDTYEVERFYAYPMDTDLHIILDALIKNEFKEGLTK